MEFFAIMFIGTVIAVLLVLGTRPDQQLYRVGPPPLDLPGPIQDDREAEVWQFQPMDQVEHLEALELHLKDPNRNPCPSPVPPRIADFE
jgi:hypothetical protein